MNGRWAGGRRGGDRTVERAHLLHGPILTDHVPSPAAVGRERHPMQACGKPLMRAYYSRTHTDSDMCDGRRACAI